MTAEHLGVEMTNSIIEINETFNASLIHIWIPSVFLRSDKSDSHHVYQVFLDI